MGKPNIKTAEIRRHWGRVAALGCIVGGGAPAQVAHCHGGSITETLGPKFRPGWSQKQNHWLVLPLQPAAHRLLDADVGAFEHAYGSQIVLLEEVAWCLGYDIFHLAGAEGYEYQTRNAPDSKVPQ